MSKLKHYYSLCALSISIAIFSASAQATEVGLHDACKDIVTNASKHALLKRAVMYAPQGATDNIETAVKESNAINTALMKDEFGKSVLESFAKKINFGTIKFSDLTSASGVANALYEKATLLAQQTAAKVLDNLIDKVDSALTRIVNGMIDNALTRLNQSYEKTVSRLSGKLGKYGTIFVDNAFQGLLKNSLNHLANCAKSSSVKGDIASVFGADSERNLKCYENVLNTFEKEFDNNRFQDASNKAWKAFHQVAKYQIGNKVRDTVWKFEEKNSRFAKYVNDALANAEKDYTYTRHGEIFSMVSGVFYEPLMWGKENSLYSVVTGTASTIDDYAKGTVSGTIKDIKANDYLGNFARVFGREETN